MFAADVTMDLAEWIIDDTCFEMFIFTSYNTIEQYKYFLSFPV